jgi:acetyl-CoA carboxylase carboxyltransferase component
MSNRISNLAEQRILKLLDEGSFMEVGSLVTARNTDFNLTQADTSSDGVITGHGLIDGNLVFIYSQDASVVNGTIGEMHAKKIAAVYDRAIKMGAPVIGLLDCAGVRLQESIDALDALGMIYEKQVMASGVVPQISAVFGTCGGGLTVVPGLSDFSFMEAEKAKMFVNSPNSIEGNRIEKCDPSVASFQSENNGILDGIGSEDEIIAAIRELVCLIPGDNTENGRYDDCMDDLNRVCESLDTMKGDPRYILSQISDSNSFFEVKKDFAPEMVIGFLKLNGMTIGAVANCSEVYDLEGNKIKEFDSVLTAKGCEKSAEFISFCDAFDIPILSLTNVTGFKSCICSEKNLAKAMSRLTFAFANATVPKVNLITGKAYGSAAVTMNSKSIGADLVYAWPTAKTGMMDAKLAAGIMYASESPTVIEQKANEYDALQSDIATAARRGYVDLLVEPADSRKYLVAAFEMLYTKNMDTPFKKHGAK